VAIITSVHLRKLDLGWNGDWKAEMISSTVPSISLFNHGALKLHNKNDDDNNKTFLQDQDQG